MADRKASESSETNGKSGGGGSDGGRHSKADDTKRESKDDSQHKSPKKRRKVNHGTCGLIAVSCHAQRSLPLFFFFREPLANEDMCILQLVYIAEDP